MAPKSWLRTKFSCRTDFWSLGMSFWEILTGENPLPDLSNFEVIELYTKLPQQIYQHVKPPAGLHPELFWIRVGGFRTQKRILLPKSWRSLSFLSSSPINRLLSLYCIQVFRQVVLKTYISRDPLHLPRGHAHFVVTPSIIHFPISCVGATSKIASINIPSLIPPANAAARVVTQSALASHADTPVMRSGVLGSVGSGYWAWDCRRYAQETSGWAWALGSDLSRRSYSCRVCSSLGQQILNGLNALQGSLNTLQGSVNTLLVCLSVEIENVSIRSGNRMIGQNARLNPFKKSVVGDCTVLASNQIPDHPLNPFANVPALGSTPPFLKRRMQRWCVRLWRSRGWYNFRIPILGSFLEILCVKRISRRSQCKIGSYLIAASFCMRKESRRRIKTENWDVANGLGGWAGIRMLASTVPRNKLLKVMKSRSIQLLSTWDSRWRSRPSSSSATKITLPTSCSTSTPWPCVPWTG